MAKTLPKYNFVRPIVANDYLPAKQFSIPDLAAFGDLADVKVTWQKRGVEGMTFSVSGGGAAITDAAGWVFTLGDIDLTMEAGDWTAQVELTDDSGRKHTYFQVGLTVLTDQTIT
jgi:hypothetical protein